MQLNDSYSFDANAVRNFFRKEKDKMESDKIFEDGKGLRILLNQKDGEKEENIPSESRYIVETIGKDEKNFKYYGYLNEEAKRNTFGCQKFNTDSSFIGTWKNDEMLHGIYFYNPSEIFVGEFEKGEKTKGVYFWHPKEENFDAFIGDFLEDKTHHGLHYSHQKLLANENAQEQINEEHLYLGKFSQGQRNDENGLYFLHHKNIFFQGKIQGEKLIEGAFKKGSQNSEIFQIKRNKEDLPFTEIVKDSQITAINHNYELLKKNNWSDDLSELYKKCISLRDQFLSINAFISKKEEENFIYFSEIYKKMKDIESNVKPLS